MQSNPFLYFTRLVRGAVLAVAAAAAASAYDHPGGVISNTEIARIRARVITSTQQPHKLAWDNLRFNSRLCQDNYAATPHTEVWRKDSVNGYKNETDLKEDSGAAVLLAVKAAVLQDSARWDDVVGILNAWLNSPSKINEIYGEDRFIAAAIYGRNLAEAAELVHEYYDWPTEAADVGAWKTTFAYVFAGLIDDMVTGVPGHGAVGNQEAMMMAAKMTIGVFIGNNSYAGRDEQRNPKNYNGQNMFNQAVDRFKGANGSVGNGTLNQYVNPNAGAAFGQVAETGRDLGHAQLGIGLLAACAKIYENANASNAAIKMDLWKQNSNLLLAGAAYIAKWAMQDDTTSKTTTFNTANYDATRLDAYQDENHHWQAKSLLDRGRLQATYEMIYAAYGHVSGANSGQLTTVAKAVQYARPEFADVGLPGLGTLLYAEDTMGSTKPAPYYAIRPNTFPVTGTSGTTSFRNDEYYAKTSSVLGATLKADLRAEFTDQKYKDPVTGTTYNGGAYVQTSQWPEDVTLTNNYAVFQAISIDGNGRVNLRNKAGQYLSVRASDRHLINVASATGGNEQFRLVQLSDLNPGFAWRWAPTGGTEYYVRYDPASDNFIADETGFSVFEADKLFDVFHQPAPTPPAFP